MNFGYMLRFIAISVGVGLGTAVGCGGANSSDLLDPSGGPGPLGDSGGNPPGQDGGGGSDTGSGSDTGTDANPPGQDSGPPASRGVRCDNGSSTERFCSGGQPLCCISTNFIGTKSYSCLSAGGDCGPDSSHVPARCDSNDDCRQGQRCCGHLTGSNQDQHFDRISCEQDQCSGESVQVCTTDDDCRGGAQCKGTDPQNSIYHFCQ